MNAEPPITTVVSAVIHRALSRKQEGENAVTKAVLENAVDRMRTGEGLNLSAGEIALLLGALRGVTEAPAADSDVFLAMVCLEELPQWGPDQILEDLQRAADGLASILKSMTVANRAPLES